MGTLAVPYAAPILENIIADALSALCVSSPSPSRVFGLGRGCYTPARPKNGAYIGFISVISDIVAWARWTS